MRYIADSDEDQELKTLREPPPTAYLVLLVRGQPSHAFPLRGEIRLGRDKDNAVVVADQKVSRHHASLTPIDHTFIITDQGSVNGTYLNGVQIAQPTRLKHHDRLTLGDTTFLFTIGQPDITGLEAAVPPAAAPIPTSQPAAHLPNTLLSSTHLTIWVTLGCMALVIIALLFALALLLGWMVGSTHLFGWSMPNIG